MSDAKRVLKDALALPTATRGEVAAALLASLEPDIVDDDESSSTWTSEIEARAERVRRGNAQGKPWALVRSRLMTRLGLG